SWLAIPCAGNPPSARSRKCSNLACWLSCHLVAVTRWYADPACKPVFCNDPHYPRIPPTVLEGTARISPRSLLATALNTASWAVPEPEIIHQHNTLRAVDALACRSLNGFLDERVRKSGVFQQLGDGTERQLFEVYFKTLRRQILCQGRWQDLLEANKPRPHR